MAIRLFANAVDSRAEELLAGVPAGTALRLQEFEARRAAGTLEFTFAALAATPDYQCGVQPGYHTLAYAQLCQDPELAALSDFRTCGFERVSPRVWEYLTSLGFPAGEFGSVTDPEVMAILLDLQGVHFTSEQKALVTEVYWC